MCVLPGKNTHMSCEEQRGPWCTGDASLAMPPGTCSGRLCYCCCTSVFGGQVNDEACVQRLGAW